MDFNLGFKIRQATLLGNLQGLEQFRRLIDRYEVEMHLLKARLDETQLATFYPLSAEEKIAEDLALLRELADEIEERINIQPGYSLEQIWSQLKHRGPAHLSELIAGIESRDYPTFIEMKTWAISAKQPHPPSS